MQTDRSLVGFSTRGWAARKDLRLADDRLAIDDTIGVAACRTDLAAQADHVAPEESSRRAPEVDSSLARKWHLGLIILGS